MTRPEWEQEWHQISQQAIEAKASPSALPRLFERYRSLNPDDQAVVNGWMCDALLEDDEVARFDAIAMIWEFDVNSALPKLEILAAQLEVADTPSAPYEWAKVNRVIASLRAGT